MGNDSGIGINVYGLYLSTWTNTREILTWKEDMLKERSPKSPWRGVQRSATSEEFKLESIMHWAVSIEAAKGI